MVLEKFEWPGWAKSGRNYYKPNAKDLELLQKLLDRCYKGSVRVNPHTPSEYLELNIVEVTDGAQSQLIPLWDLLTNYVAFILYSNNWRRVKHMRSFLPTSGDYNLIERCAQFYTSWKMRKDPGFKL